MEKQETQNIEVVKARSYVASLREGLKFPLLHFGELFRFLWPMLLVAGVVYTAVKTAELRIITGLTDPSKLTMQEIGTMGLLEIISFATLCLLGGHVLLQIQQLVIAGRLSAGKPWKLWRQILLPSVRAMVGSLIVVALMLAFVVLLVMGLNGHQPLFFLAALLPALLLLLQLPVLLEYLFTKSSYVAAFSQAGWRHLGRALLVLFVALLPVLFIEGIALLPYALVTYIDIQVIQAASNGDVVVLPAFFPWLRALCLMIYVLAASFASLFLAYPLLFHWGATKAIEQGRKAYIEQGD